MSKKIPTILLALGCIALVCALYVTKQENRRLQQEAAAQGPAMAPGSSQVVTPDRTPGTAAEAEPVTAMQSGSPETVQSIEDPVVQKDEEPAARRMMNSMAQMMENPTMNKVMVASQRGVIGALYSDMIDSLGLTEDETSYFMELLMYRQMQQMDLSMKMMGGNMSDEEKTAMADDLIEVDKTVKAEMEKFLNNPEDYEEFEFYEKTMGERMMLSQMEQTLTDPNAALSDETYNELLTMMHDEKTGFNFTTDLSDQENRDLSPARFSKDNLQAYASDMDNLNGKMIQKAETLLTPEQLAAFETTIQSMAEMQKAQLEMAAQMFGGGK